ncbi:DUF3967 domain-containing protein [Mesorhizobium sp. M7A.F.Ca.MR.362.00.0.0]|uniref:DUF3967 domain-containing protein n=1 Tax=Mesorhizobium sp. M7A.F.Ca.MR.362.00.0.0 TaxID=2496779 RepID=UPI000FD18C20|nr:DUF3967 domain-containing protein [Mesorhizobium sp. M7A.F.Ca.MR.362.00.0.0]RUU74308.1 DUF3967 domain-containing protein [Mesorhizobium sp. M7A.F.Ca.MR.362.00.0.0]
MKENKTYTSSEIAKQILVEPVTVRKYSQMLEDKGYIFNRDNKDHRRYTDNDLTAFKHLTALRNNGLSVDESINHIANLYHHNLSILPTDTTLHQEESPLLTFIKKQEEFNQKILEQLERQEQRQRERDQNLMYALRETQETKKQLAVSQQKKWWKFWVK